MVQAPTIDTQRRRLSAGALLGLAGTSVPWPALAAPTVPTYRFNAPAGWARSHESGAIVFKPPREPANTVILMLVPPVVRAGDFASQFDVMRTTVESNLGLRERANVWQQQSGGGAMEQRVHLATYQSNDGPRVLVVMARAQGNWVGSVLFMTSSADAYDRLESRASEFFESLRLDGAGGASGAVAAVQPTGRANSALRGGGISGVWMGLVLLVGSYTPEYRWKTFFDDGVAFGDLPNGGMAGFNREAARRVSALSDYWNTYTFAGSSGELRREGTSAKWGLQLLNRDQLKIGSDTFYRCASVDGLRLDGSWTSYANPDDPSLDALPVGQRPVIRFGRDGRFRDDGLFATFITSGGDDRPGGGQYEMRDFSLILRYDDGRLRQEAFTGFLGANPRDQNAKVFVRRSQLSRRARS